jgi:hypothetical protein
MISDRLQARMRRSFCALWFVVCALASVPCARAQGESEGEYKELIDQALLEFKHKNWPEARVLFRRAHEISPNARTSRGMGVVSYEMRDYVQAVRDLTAALADQRQALTEAQRSECQTLLARSRTFVGVFAVNVTPPEAELRVDGGRVTRESDGTLLLAFGSHVLRASAPGHEDGTVHVNVQGGESGSLDLVLVKAGGTGPVAVAPELPQPGAEPTSEPVESTPSVGHEKTGGLRYTWVALGASVAFGAGAVAAWYVGDQKLNDLDDACAKRAARGSPCTKGTVSTETVESYERLTNAAIGLSAAALAAAGVLAYFEWPRERAISVGLGPSSLSLRGEF